MALDTNIGTHAPQLRGKHEAIFKNVLGDDGAAVGKRVENHNLRLHIGGEARERQGLDINGFEVRGAVHAHTTLNTLVGNPHELKLLEHHAQMMRVEANHLNATLARCKGTGDNEGPRLDAVANHLVRYGMKLLHALDGNHRRTGTR